MEKGQLGLRLSFYAVVAFIFVLFGQITPLILLTGVAIIVEKNVWLTRQMIQAVALCFFEWAVSYALSLLGYVTGTINAITYVDGISKFMSILRNICDLGVEITVLVFVILAISRVAKGKEAKVPVAAKFANWACGIVMMKQQ